MELAAALAIALAIAVAGSAPVAAEDEGAIPHPTAAVGVMLRAGRGGCTATLIRHDVVLTAAHCMAGTDQDEVPATLAFRTGSYPGTATVTVHAAEVIVHPLYLRPETALSHRISYDIALVRLAGPVPPLAATPIALGPGIEPAASVFLASWRGGLGVRARERSCPVLDWNERWIAFGCDVRSGESGAPLMVRDDGALKIVGVVTNRSEVAIQPIGYGASADRVGQLLALLGPAPDP